MDPFPLWYESIQHTFILAHYVTPLKWGWLHSITLGRLPPHVDRTDDHRRVATQSIADRWPLSGCVFHAMSDVLTANPLR
jgi:hypothetical protein